MDPKDYFERFSKIKSVQRLSRQLEDTCEVLGTFRPKIKKALDDGVDLSPRDKRALEGLAGRYSSILKELNDEFKKFPK